ncbi:OLC1v1003997C1 [Oldenlandia corymbosa var. corymbosa]|uniref:Auxin response factor n=1 Tax=Oldenlandia corymbosa var. corymbosa TaxID=529605 RepID=A0AAV1DC19_OLDCO|nr:OLC1v1003997C1 [Oldenlandia corymbosa var. corymbosa]
MEIDLNHALESEVEKNACGCNGECGKVVGGCAYCSFSTSTSSCSSNSSSSNPPPPSKIFKELWYACAGPVTNLPKKGNVVVYFPQGHLEQAASVSSFPLLDVPTFDLQPQIFCRILDVELLANKENDEVYTQLTLLPISEFLALRLEGKEQEEAGTDEEGTEAVPLKSTSHMFCKTLTASDTSTHGGFSVPRRAAEDCFPPLDYKEQRPSQELVAKDLHGVEWKFRHIYRGQPRRHLLTTGWSIFVSQKNLVSGDAVLFLRGDGGDLRLGVRRAAGLRNGLSDSIIKSQTSYPNVLAAVANAVSSNSPFKIFYSTRANHADFIVPYQKYAKSITNPIPPGTRFKISVDLDDAPERRYSGVVTGYGDMEPRRWLNSKWRCLTVRWDEDVTNHHERVSPWEIDFSAAFPTLSIQTPPRMKKQRICMQGDMQKSTKSSADLLLPLSYNDNVPGAGRKVMFPSTWNSYIPGQVSLWDFAESVGSGKVLQGQENLGLPTPLYGCDKVNRQLEFEMHPVAPQSRLVSNRMEKAHYGNFSPSQPSSTTYSGSLESSNCFPKVLQGQEICSLKSLTGKNELNPGIWRKPELGGNIFNQRTLGSYPLATEGVRNVVFPYGGVFKGGQDPVMVSYVGKLQRDTHVATKESSFRDSVNRDEGLPNLSNEQKALEKTSALPNSGTPLNIQRDENKDPGPVCKLFGFSLVEEVPTSSSQNSRRSCTKVHKQGNKVGRAIDLSKLNSYSDLLIELERLFSMEGLLQDPSKGWRILYTDSENDMMVVGDDPWHEFCEVVSKIHIYTQEEVEKMNIGVISEDTRSCLEESPPRMDGSKSSSVSAPDSSPTVVRI